MDCLDWLKIEKRFCDKVEILPEDSKLTNGEPCWAWRAHITRGGYGQFGLNGKVPYAHRVSFEACYGPIPDGMEIDHQCRVRYCVNPAHLRLATISQNRRYRKATNGSTSNYLGVCWDKKRRKWLAQIVKGDQYQHLGRFDSEADAARAFNKAALARDPEFTNLNVIDE